MNADFSRYPPLPDAPKLPEWRDTPEREAYFDELDRRTALSSGRVLLLFGASAVGAGAVCFRSNAASLTDRLCMAGGICCLLFIVFQFCLWLFWRIRLAFGYRVFPLMLRRYGVSDGVKRILDARPDFVEAEFCGYWPTAEYADAALQVLRWAKEIWAVPDKMLYPNDSLMLLYNHKQRGIEDHSDFADRFGSEWAEVELMGYDCVFAELVEAYLTGRQRKDAEAVK